MTDAGRVIVVGSVNIDLVVAVERLPGPGETVTGGRFTRHHGGKGGNQAVAAARLGASTWFVGAVGDDAFGAEARAALSDDGVHVDALLSLEGHASGVAFILVDAAGENVIAVASGANGELSASAVSAALARLAPGPGDVVLVGHEIPTATAAAALRAARDAGALTILNPAPADGLDAATLALADVLTPNEREAAALATACGPLAGLAPVVIVSRGATGATLETADGRMVVPAPVVQVVDTVGAGDALNGALAAGLAAGLDLAEATRRAVVAASVAVTRQGARSGMPTAEELSLALALAADDRPSPDR